MERREFLQQLEKALAGLKPETVQEIMADYEEYFEDAARAGRQEAEVAAKLGSPRQLAKELKAQAHYRAWEAQRTLSNLGRVALALARLGALNFLLMLPFLLYLSLLTMGYLIAGFFAIFSLTMLAGIALLHFGVQLPGEPVRLSSAVQAAVNAGGSPLSVRSGEGRWGLEFRSGDKFTLTGVSGAVLRVSKQDGRLVSEAADPAARALLQWDGEKASAAIDKLAALQWQAADGSKLSWQRDQAGETLQMHGREGDISVRAPASAFSPREGMFQRTIMEFSKDGGFVKDFGEILLACSAVLILLMALSHYSWRALGRYLRYQLSLLKSARRFA